jgi:hypothetical protein
VARLDKHKQHWRRLVLGPYGCMEEDIVL